MHRILRPALKAVPSNMKPQTRQAPSIIIIHSSRTAEGCLVSICSPVVVGKAIRMIRAITGSPCLV